MLPSSPSPLSEYNRDEISIKGIPVQQLMREQSFVGAICLLLRGTLPSASEAKLLEALLTSTVIHTEHSPSIVAAKTASGGGASLEAAIAAGCLTMGAAHGGAVSALAELLQNCDPSLTSEDAAKSLLEKQKALGMRVPGFGHPIHPIDPRTVTLFEMAQELGLFGRYCAITTAIADEIKLHSNKVIPINITGAMAAVLSDLGFHWRITTAFFLLSRTVGMVATIQEENR